MMDLALVCHHLGMGDVVAASGAVRYFASKYSKVYAFSKLKYFHNTTDLYQDLGNVYVLPVADSEPHEQQHIQHYISHLGKNADIYTAGIYNPRANKWENLPDNFARDLGLDMDTLKKYFAVPQQCWTTAPCPKEKKWVFFHSVASHTDASQEMLGNYTGNLLLVNPSKNMYEPTHPFWQQAQEFVGLPFWSYVTTIKHAQEIHVIDSSFSNLCAFIAQPDQEKHVYLKSGFSYHPEFFPGWHIHK